MHPRWALVLATALTAFTLVAVGAVFGSRAPTTVAATPPEPTLSVDNGDTSLPLTTQREMDYRALVATANAQMNQANTALRQAHEREVQLRSELATARAAATTSQHQSVPTAPKVSAAIAPQRVISAEQAVALAQRIAPGATLSRRAELVEYQGTPTYEVVFDRGTVYVDAVYGTIMYDGTTPPEQAVQRTTFGHDETSDDEHGETEQEGDYDD